MPSELGKVLIRQPDPGSLDADQQEVVTRFLILHEQWDPSSGPFESVNPELIAQFEAATCASPSAFMRMFGVASSYVYWTRSRAFCLTRLLQLALRGTIYNAPAAGLFASAQININEDLSLSSMENAVLMYSQLEQAGHEVGHLLERERGRLRDVYWHLRDWYWPMSRGAVLPLHRHLYQTRCFAEMKLFAPDLPGEERLTPEDFTEIAERCETADSVYYRIVARRFAGEWYERSGNPDAACDQYRQALDESLRVELDTETGHLRRHLGHALAVLNRLPEAAEQLEQAWRHETENGCAYWRALSFGELGEVEAALAERAETPAEREGCLDRAQEAFRHGQDSIDMFLSRQSSPVSRAIAQQAYRPYAEDALRVVTHTTGVVDWLGRFEVGSPRNAMEMALEGRLVRESYDELTVSAFMRSRAFYSQWWESFRPGQTNEQAVDAYLASLSEMLAEGVDKRRPYLDIHNTPVVLRPLADAYDSRRCAERFVNEIRWPGVALLLFSLSQRSETLLAEEHMTMTVFDTATGELRGPPCHVGVGEEVLRPHHDVYNEQVAQAAADAGLIAPDASMKNAIATLLDTYSLILSDPLRHQLPALKDLHVKIVPRGMMHEVPLHALRIDGARLIDHCDLSYGLTLGLLSEAHKEERATFDGLTILWDPRTTWYEGLVRLLSKEHGEKIRVLEKPTLNDVIAELRASPPDELLVACHGRYDPDDPQASLLWLDGTTETRFTDVLRQVSLDDCGCVTLGACESGLGRNLVTAEHIGLPVALMSAGARQVIGTLWQTPELATAVLLTHYYRYRVAGRSVVAALNQAQRDTKKTTPDGIMEWISSALPDKAANFSSIVPTLFPEGFSDPYYWAAFYARGDV